MGTPLQNLRTKADELVELAHALEQGAQNARFSECATILVKIIEKASGGVLALMELNSNPAMTRQAARVLRNAADQLDPPEAEAKKKGGK
jgi:hypothetical protein